MEFLKQRKAIFLVTLLFISFAAEFGDAIRPWQGEQLFRQIMPNFESLQRGPVPPSAGTPCSNIPGGSGKCVVSEMNVAGHHLLRSPPTFPGINVIKLAATALHGE